MEPLRPPHSLFPQQFMFTVSNPSHELVTPNQYTQLVSTISQYQLIPGFMSQAIDDPWDVVLRLLPYSRNTILDVTLPYVSATANGEGIRTNESRTIGRYILYKQQLIGIRVLTTSNKAPLSQQNSKTHPPNPWIQEQFKCRKQAIPIKLQNYYLTHQIHGYQTKTTVGDFYLTTSKFKLALLFLSQIKSASVIQPYLMIGCEVVSIVNDLEIEYQTFINYYLKKDYHDSLIEGNKTVITDLRKLCWQSNVILLYGGCKTSETLGKVHFTRSIIEYGGDVDSAPQWRALETEDVQFYPLIDLTQDKDFVAQPEHNGNRLNVSKKYNLRKNRTQSPHKPSLSYTHAMNKELQLQSLVMDPKKFQIRPLTKQSIQKLLKLQQMNYFYQRQKLFNLAQVTGRSMIKCMYVFNMLNLFIFSKPKQLQSPFLIGVPFTQKTKNLFDIFIYIYDNIKNYESQAPDLEQDLKLSNILLLYRYKDERNTKHDYAIEEKMLQEITGMKDAWIPEIEMLINFHNKKKPFYLCSDDIQEKKKLKAICKEAQIETVFVDVLTIDEFALPLEIKSTHEPEIDCVLELQKYHNVLENYSIKLREMPSLEQVNAMRQKEMRKAEHPPIYGKLSQEIQKKHFLSINQALRWIIEQKEIIYDERNQKMITDLVMNQLGKKLKSNIKTLSQINKFFIVNSQEQIIQKITQICQQLIKPNIKQNNFLKSVPSNPHIITLDQDSQVQKENTNQSNTKPPNQTKKPDDKQRSPEQLYLLRLQKCKRLKAQRNKGTIVKCHKCHAEMEKKLIEKCKNCSEMFCLLCIEEISGLSGPKVTQQLYKFCIVCSRLCDCEKCKKKIDKLFGGAASTKLRNQPIISEELKKFLMQDETKSQPTPANKPSTNAAQLLLTSLTSSDPPQKIQLKRCQRCQILNTNQHRNITLQCKQCGTHECYFCVQQKYKQTRYKQSTIKTFYKNYKCELCDQQWQKFIENKFKEKEILDRMNAESQMMHEGREQSNLMDVEVNSNRTSHYANDNLDIPGFGGSLNDPRLNFINRKRRNSMDVQVQAHRQRKDSFSDINFIQSHTQPNLDNRNPQQYAPFFNEVNKQPIIKSPYPELNPKKVTVPDKYPLPNSNPGAPQIQTPPFIQVSQVKKTNCDKPQSKTQSGQKKPRRTSSDSGYQSQDKKKKDQGASSVKVSFRQKSQNKKNGPLWPNKNKAGKRSSSGSVSKKGKSSDSNSLASFNPKKKGSKQREVSCDKNKGSKGLNKVSKKQKQKEKRHKKSKKIGSYESGMVSSSSSSSNSSSSSSSRSSSSSSSSKSSKHRSRSRNNTRKPSRRHSSNSRSSSIKDKKSKRSRQRQMKFSRSNSNSEQRQRSSTKRSDSGMNDRGHYHRGRGGYRGRGSYHNSGSNEDRANGYSNWRGTSSGYVRGGSDWRDTRKDDNSDARDGRYNSSTSYRGAYESSFRGGRVNTYNSNNNERGFSTHNNHQDYERSYDNSRDDPASKKADSSQAYRSSRFYKQDNTRNEDNMRKQPQPEKNTSGLLFVNSNRNTNKDDNIQY